MLCLCEKFIVTTSFVNGIKATFLITSSRVGSGFHITTNSC